MQQEGVPGPSGSLRSPGKKIRAPGDNPISEIFPNELRSESVPAEGVLHPCGYPAKKTGVLEVASGSP
jgi:hypothetical protein